MPITKLKPYVGRYAPSPTGDLHLGNLRTALLAWLDARKNKGQFLVRMEDLDTPRTVKGSADKILSDLEWLGLDWDGEVMYQSLRKQRYEEALNYLSSKDLTYPCFCSRKDIQLAASAPHKNHGVYPGTCFALSESEKEQRALKKTPAIRLKVNADLAKTCGDFVIRRADQLFAYQLAVVVDDIDQGVTDVVRGEDLLESTDRQRYLAKQLEPDVPSIKYHHVPLMLDSAGKRMAKRDGSESAEQWRSSGRTAEQLIGKLAFDLGLLESNNPISSQELLLISDIRSTFFKKY